MKPAVCAPADCRNHIPLIPTSSLQRNPRHATIPCRPIKGFVLTDKKENPLVETLSPSPTGQGDKNNTNIRPWTYGLGEAIIFRDTATRWTGDWVNEGII